MWSSLDIGSFFYFILAIQVFFSLGINDGIYLVHGGKTRVEVDKNNIASNFFISLMFECIAAIIIVAIALMQMDSSERSFVLGSVAIYMILYCVSGFLGCMFQMMNETKLFSFSVVLDKFAFLLPLVFLLALRIDDFRCYIVFYVIAKLICSGYCIWLARDFFVLKNLSIIKTIPSTFKYIHVGICLMLSNIASMLILGIGRFCIDAAWGISTFGQLSFSLSLVTFITGFIVQFGMVLFPALRQTSESGIRSFFRIAQPSLSILLPGAFLLFWPMCAFINFWLPQYSDSIYYFVYLLPLCAFDGKMNIIGTTFLKVKRRERLLLLVNMSAVLISLVGAIVGAFFVEQIEWVVFAMLLAVVFRSVVSEFYVSKMVDISSSRLSFVEIILSLVFIITAISIEGVFGFLVYLFAYILYLVFARGDVKFLISSMKKIKLIRSK